MNLTRKPLAVFVTWLMFGLSSDFVWGASDAITDEIVESSIFGEELAMSDATLDEMRGGFTTTSGLQVTFGIERMVIVNGTLISTTSLNVSNATANIPGVDKLSTPAMTLQQSNASAPASSASMPSGVALTSAAPATAASATSASSSAPSSTPTSSVTSTPGSVALIQIGGGNTVSPGAFSTSSAGTVVQNTLNNQKIQSVTIISATVNSLQILKALNVQLAIGSAVNDSVRK